MKEKLKEEMDLANWSMLHPHFVRDTLYWVDESLDFIETCEAIAKNDAPRVEELINKKLLKRPDGLDVEKWHKEKPVFKCLIISPHVLIQLTDISLNKDSQSDKA
ncbi:MAG: DUF2288 domain-containing protein [Lentisphaeraceae bacterium]|nr:DUF2288 domain-containing protein [Lentisphaeraceae bacterium]